MQKDRVTLPGLTYLGLQDCAVQMLASVQLAHAIVLILRARHLDDVAIVVNVL